ncbi:hypothetical protein NRB15_11670 [Pseudomonas alliivorans]|nr:hypothetical protein [Pseudomonas alliivorans]MCQ9471000.1 hypothetical protein [Pseudomonas alliivorans]
MLAPSSTCKDVQDVFGFKKTAVVSALVAGDSRFINCERQPVTVAIQALKDAGGFRAHSQASL